MCSTTFLYRRGGVRYRTILVILPHTGGGVRYRTILEFCPILDGGVRYRKFLGRVFICAATLSYTGGEGSGTGCGFRNFPDVWNPPPPRGGGQKKIFPQNLHTATHLIFWGFWGFWVKKGNSPPKKNGPKMAQKWSKMAKIAPKSAK